MATPAASESAPEAHRPEGRIFGLDIMRAGAVLFVMLGHFLAQSRTPPWLRRSGNLGMLGVEIFFVLSGYLIGGIILDLMEKNRFADRWHLYTFWGRRWLRTLPLYYLFFFLYLRFDPSGPSALARRIPYLVFLQNFAWRSSNFFILSWSLAIEEYFYLFFPFVLLVLIQRLGKPRKAFVAAILLFLLLPLALRLWLCPIPFWQDYDVDIRIKTVTRLDSLMYGVGAVFIHRYYPALWQAVRRWRWLAGLAGFASFLYFYLNMPGIFGNYFLECFVFPLVNLSFALNLPYFSGLGRRPSGFLGWAVAGTSKISYSIYLSHVMVLTLVNQALHALPRAWDLVYPRFWLLYPLYLACIFPVSALTYRFWELPFMRLRRRLPQ